MMHKYVRCEFCNERWLVSYSLYALITRPRIVQTQIASIELEAQCHRTDHVLDNLYLQGVLNG
jgi:hypothetical protein